MKTIEEIRRETREFTLQNKTLVKNFIETLLDWKEIIPDPYYEDNREDILYAIFEAIETELFKKGIRGNFNSLVKDYDDETIGILMLDRKVLVFWRGNLFSYQNERNIDAYIKVLRDCYEEALKYINQKSEGA
ncbi:hypothetical protein [Desulfurobacterium sp.]